VTPRRLLAHAGALALIASQAGASCELYWLEMWGKDLELHFQIEDSIPLAHYLDQRPFLRPTGSGLPEAVVLWNPTHSPPTVRPVGTIAGRAVYDINYRELNRVLVWEDADWSFCPVLILEADSTIVSRIDPSDLFTSEGREVVSVRTHFQGTGSIQESLFFAIHDGVLTHIRHDDDQRREFVESEGIEIHHRNGGFCAGSLTWENMAWKKDPALWRPEGTMIRLNYRIQARDLILDTGELLATERPNGCIIRPDAE
jgi:hypothetical protein